MVKPPSPVYVARRIPDGGRARTGAVRKRTRSLSGASVTPGDCIPGTASSRTRPRGELRRWLPRSFFVLARTSAFESIKSLIGGEHPDLSWVGIALAVASVIVMPAS